VKLRLHLLLAVQELLDKETLVEIVMQVFQMVLAVAVLVQRVLRLLAGSVVLAVRV
jgi:hypothetical protein